MQRKQKRSNKQFLIIVAIALIFAVIPAILAITANQIAAERNPQTLTVK